MSIKHLVFDWDGTLADTFPVITAAYNHAFDQLGMKRIPYAEIKHITSQLQNKDILENIFGPRKTEAGIAYYDFIQKHHASNLESIPHARELLDYCQKQGLKCYLITNKKTHFIKEELFKLSFNNFFSKIVAAGEYAEDKPHPLATHAVFANNLPPANEILVVGDGEADVKTAHTYNHHGQKAQSVIYDPKQTYQGETPDYKTTDLLDIIKILEEKMPKIAETEKRNQDTINIDLMDAYHIAKAINHEDQKIAVAIQKVLPDIAKAIDSCVSSINKGGKIGYFGAGTSGKIAILDATDCPQTFGIKEDLIQSFIAGGDECIRASINGSEDSAELAQADIATFNASTHDVVISISASGNPAYVVSILEEAQKRGATTIGICSNPNAKLKPFAAIFINPILGQEAICGSSRMKSGTAQKMILNMISTATMIRLGKIFENMMIDVDVSNQKLYDRSCLMIAAIGNVSEDKAKQYLEQSDKNVKTACVMAVKKCSRSKAETLLQSARGILRKIIC